MSMYGQLESGAHDRMDFAPLVVFLAFSIESYINSVGARKIVVWDEVERLSWKKKVVILHKTANKAPDWSKDPLQFAIDAFALRDRLAHGKPEMVFGPVFASFTEAYEYDRLGRKLQPEWYAGITKEWIMQAKERHRLLMTYIGGLFDLHESDHLKVSTGGVLTDDGQGPQCLIAGQASIKGDRSSFPT